MSGKILVDAGAARAIGKMSKSLLPSGVLLAEGGFHRGDIVSVFCADTEIAKGMVFYSCEDINKIKGHKSSEIHKLLCRRDMTNNPWTTGFFRKDTIYARTKHMNFRKRLPIFNKLFFHGKDIFRMKIYFLLDP